MGIAMAVRNPTRSAGAPPERGSNRELATALIFLVPAAIDFLASSSTRRSRGFYLRLQRPRQGREKGWSSSSAR